MTAADHFGTSERVEALIEQELRPFRICNGAPTPS